MRDRLRHRGPDGTGLRQNDGGGPGFAHIRLAVIRSQPRRRPVIPSRPSSPMLHEETGAPSADVSVIIPAYRAAATIGRALASVAAQTMRPKEAIVVDDGSDDGTAEAAQAAASIMAGIPLKVLTQPHGGAGAARNRALCEASGTYVAFLDADDEWLSEKLRRSMEHLEGTDNILVAHDGWFVGDDGETLIACAQRFREERDPFVTLYRKGYIATCSVVARRDAVLAEGFDESLPNAQDFELWLAMLREPGTRFLVFDDPLVRYHPSKSGITSHTAAAAHVLPGDRPPLRPESFGATRFGAGEPGVPGTGHPRRGVPGLPVAGQPDGHAADGPGVAPQPDIRRRVAARPTRFSPPVTRPLGRGRRPRDRGERSAEPQCGQPPASARRRKLTLDMTKPVANWPQARADASLTRPGRVSRRRSTTTRAHNDSAPGNPSSSHSWRARLWGWSGMTGPRSHW